MEQSKPVKCLVCSGKGYLHWEALQLTDQCFGCWGAERVDEKRDVFLKAAKEMAERRIAWLESR